MGRFSSWPLLASQAIDQPGQVSRLYLAGLAAGVEERPHALCGGRPSERFTEQLVLDPQTRLGSPTAASTARLAVAMTSSGNDAILAASVSTNGRSSSGGSARLT